MKTTTLSFDEKYQAIVEKNPTYEGVFIVAVKTTKIFCRPVCTARKPKRENVEFYNSTNEALQQGYRACKVCRPMEAAGEIPTKLASLLRDLHNAPNIKVKDEDLKDIGLEPNGVRRWFKKNYGMTFQAYQRMLRLNSAYQNLNSGKSVTHTAFDNGFESLSGFGDGFQKVFGVSPSKSAGKTIINMIRLTTPLGPMFACATSKGVCLLEFTDRKMLERSFDDLCQRLDAVILPGTNDHLDLLREELQQYFSKGMKRFSVPLCIPGTAFQKSVWNLLTIIPYGETRSYRDQAVMLGNPKAVRAVASANGRNRLAILIPCHRVVGSDGDLRGYAGGVSRKKWLLAHELKYR